jgi:hypothetical protein
MLANGSKRMVDGNAKVPYLIYGKDQWFGYDDPESVREKVNFAFLNYIFKHPKKFR